MDRRKALKNTALISGSLISIPFISTSCAPEKSAENDVSEDTESENTAVSQESVLFSISLAQWSLHKSFNNAELRPIDFPSIAKNQFEIDAVEYVNQFYLDKARDNAFWQELKKRSEDEGVQNVLIMCDELGDLGDPDKGKRVKAVENHYPWVETAKFLGCHSIRVNAYSSGSEEEQQKLVADGWRKLCEFSDEHDINVIVENHGGISSNAEWLLGVFEMVAHPRAGTLPDFGNFKIDENTWYDRYKGVAELMPYAKGVSAKSYDFDANGNETNTDFYKMINIVLDADYHGYIGVEYEGQELSEEEGVIATKNLLERIRADLS